MPTRRQFLGTFAAACALPRHSQAMGPGPITIAAKPATVQISPPSNPPTALWTYDGTLPGRALTFDQGDRLRAQIRNDLPQPTSVHWHGIRIDNTMDGVPGLTQPAIAPGESYHYDFALPDAGTYWYHSHAQSVEQVERGLYGPLIVRETDSPDVDDDVTLVLDDIRLDRDAAITEDFDNRHDQSHAGRLGNAWLTNGMMEYRTPVRRGQRLRLRLINAANARVFQLGIEGLSGWIVALDGMPLADVRPIDDLITLAPAQRADLIVDVTTRDAEAFLVSYERDGGYAIAVFDVTGGGRARSGAPDALPPNPDFPIGLANARTATLLMEGGAMGGLRGAMLDGETLDARALAQRNAFWAFNGVVGRMGDYGKGDPLIEVDRGESVRIALGNDTAFDHAMHLHGMHFSEVMGDGNLGPLRDTLLVRRGTVRQIAFQAHNPGDWLFHCHMLSHHATGMGTWLRVRG